MDIPLCDHEVFCLPRDSTESVRGNDRGEVLLESSDDVQPRPGCAPEPEPRTRTIRALERNVSRRSLQMKKAEDLAPSLGVRLIINNRCFRSDYDRIARFPSLHKYGFHLAGAWAIRG